MSRPRKWKDPDKKPQTLLFNKTVLNKLKAYAVETDQSFESVIKIPYLKFQEELLQLSSEIDQIRQKALMNTIPMPEDNLI